ncbi:MAG TPA: TIGR03085 family metal-binding protein [Acidimicrobiales bacterium]|nr:TIGR03085 family metal-binding protein [Acidimicrobiales bacterium]
MPSNDAPLSQRERWALCDLLTDLGPDAPTLCEGWRTADLAAHLVARDRRPDAMPGMAAPVPLLSEWSRRVQDGYRDTTTWEGLVTMARSGPPPWFHPIDQQLNTIEFFVHHEDVRRARQDWEPRQLSAGDETALWQRLRPVRFMLRKHASRLEAPGQPPIMVSAKGPVVQGPVSEVVLWSLGRRSAAQVEVSA